MPNKLVFGRDDKEHKAVWINSYMTPSLQDNIENVKCFSVFGFYKGLQLAGAMITLYHPQLFRKRLDRNVIYHKLNRLGTITLLGSVFTCGFVAAVSDPKDNYRRLTKLDKINTLNGMDFGAVIGGVAWAAISYMKYQNQLRAFVGMYKGCALGAVIILMYYTPNREVVQFDSYEELKKSEDGKRRESGVDEKLKNLRPPWWTR
eukprot:TRINITY_DN6827_c0_g1_i1.p1 TRINITY_DN6827_c0_g1~~TRINITY_DN6827_c0_g1_i1.p1  ORF type:complete len:211 (-),score=40.66 TRINITY_DN6827_c0_g1_i1:313-924(-)